MASLESIRIGTTTPEVAGRLSALSPPTPDTLRLAIVIGRNGRRCLIYAPSMALIQTSQTQKTATLLGLQRTQRQRWGHRESLMMERFGNSTAHGSRAGQLLTAASRSRARLHCHYLTPAIALSTISAFGDIIAAADAGSSPTRRPMQAVTPGLPIRLRVPLSCIYRAAKMY